jgi:hypothetical protein
MFEQTFKNIDDILHKDAGCSSELDYTEQTSWMLFLKYLDDLEHEKSLEAELMGEEYQFIIDEEHRWSSWAAPKDDNGEFDKAMQDMYWQQDKAITLWQDITDISIPTFYVKWVMGLFNEIWRGNPTYSEAAFEKTKELIIALAQIVMREMTDKERQRLHNLLQIPEWA